MSNLRAGNVHFVLQDLRLAWAFGCDCYDLVVCMLVLEHVESLDHVFSETARVLRPGGKFFICELHPYRQWQGGQAHFTDAESGRTIFVPVHWHQVSDFLNAAVRRGFQLVRIDEWRDAGAAPIAAPRLLSIHARSESNHPPIASN